MGKVGVTRPDWCGRAGVSNGVNGDFTGHFAGLVSAHAVRDYEEPLAGMPAVLVLFADSARVATQRRCKRQGSGAHGTAGTSVGEFMSDTTLLLC